MFVIFRKRTLIAVIELNTFKNQLKSELEVLGEQSELTAVKKSADFLTF